MQTKAVVGAALVAGAALLIVSRNANAETSYSEQDTSDVPVPADENPYVTPLDPYWQSIAESGEPVNNDYIRAFLFMIRCCEHLFPQNVINEACYGIFYSGNANYNGPEYLNQRFTNFADHPVITGACKAVPLSPTMCQNAGLNPGCVSTAAGAYQIIKPTWNRIRAISPALPDFSPTSQDDAAVRLLIECGAFNPLLDGNLDAALRKASTVWASLPFSSAQQNPKKEMFAAERFYEGLYI